jgi:hypothetical protein
MRRTRSPLRLPERPDPPRELDAPRELDPLRELEPLRELGPRRDPLDFFALAERDDPPERPRELLLRREEADFDFALLLRPPCERDELLRPLELVLFLAAEVRPPERLLEDEDRLLDDEERLLPPRDEEDFDPPREEVLLREVEEPPRPLLLERDPEELLPRPLELEREPPPLDLAPERLAALFAPLREDALRPPRPELEPELAPRDADCRLRAVVPPPLAMPCPRAARRDVFSPRCDAAAVSRPINLLKLLWPPSDSSSCTNSASFVSSNLSNQSSHEISSRLSAPE